MKIFFRCDATAEIGTGHVFRCLALAHAMKKKASEIVFFCRQDEADLGNVIVEGGYQVVYMPAFKSVAKFDLARKNNSFERREFESSDVYFLSQWCEENYARGVKKSENIFVVDHYLLGVAWQSKIRQLFGKLVVIDDLLDQPHRGNLIVDPNIRLPLELKRYRESIENDQDIIGGADHLIIRNSMKDCRDVAIKRMNLSGYIQNILVMFGGSDLPNFSKIAVEGCLKVKRIHVHVILGFNNPNRSEISNLFAENNRVTIHPFMKEPGHVMAICDFCIGALGTITWERCYLGLPSLIYTEQPSQKAFIKYLNDLNIVTDIGAEYSPERVALFLDQVINDKAEHIKLRRRLLRFVDGGGVKRIAEKIYGLT